MKRIIILLLGLLVTGFVSAQVDFSGKWKLNASKSQLGEQFSMSPKEVIVSQSGGVMNVEKHSEFQGQQMTTNAKYTLDGKECVNPGFQDSQNKSTALWSDDKKSLKITTKIPMGGGGDELTFVEVYSIAGENMTIKLNSSSSFGDMSETAVYDKE